MVSRLSFNGNLINTHESLTERCNGETNKSRGVRIVSIVNVLMKNYALAMTYRRRRFRSGFRFQGHGSNSNFYKPRTQVFFIFFSFSSFFSYWRLVSRYTGVSCILHNVQYIASGHSKRSRKNKCWAGDLVIRFSRFLAIASAFNLSVLIKK